ncbi:hypothetical protein L7F22_066441 [Adiantum nelumboides]|nr:hypothetical protein [Adiantum nelumboides]
MLRVRILELNRYLFLTNVALHRGLMSLQHLYLAHCNSLKVKDCEDDGDNSLLQAVILACNNIKLKGLAGPTGYKATFSGMSICSQLQIKYFKAVVQPFTYLKTLRLIGDSTSHICLLSVSGLPNVERLELGSFHSMQARISFNFASRLKDWLSFHGVRSSWFILLASLPSWLPSLWFMHPCLA